MESKVCRYMNRLPYPMVHVKVGKEGWSEDYLVLPSEEYIFDGTCRYAKEEWSISISSVGSIPRSTTRPAEFNGAFTFRTGYRLCKNK